MTKDKPTLLLSRLVVQTHENTIAYDQKFHNGVNIIRGENGSGKSTIANFIFYVLGGAYNNWTSEALRCKEVIAEVIINGACITIKRNISGSAFEPMSIYWDSFEVSKKDSINWQTYPYYQTRDTISFTNVLFNALSFPEVKGDSDSNITMHQLFRLLYIDQETPIQSLFRHENFDPPLTREAISEILLGIYDDNLYSQKLKLKQSLKEQEEKKREFDNLNKVFGKTGEITNIVGIQNEIENSKYELAKIDIAITELRIEQNVKTTKKTELNSEKIQKELSLVKNNIRNIQSHINLFDIEIADSRQFILTLEKRISELRNSLLTRQILGELPLTHCPQCLSELDNNIIEGHCILCKKPLSEESERTNAKRLLQEMELQVKESKSLLEEKERKYTSYTSELYPQVEIARSLQKQLDSSIKNPQSTRDERIDTLLIAKGSMEKKIEYLIQQIKVVELIELLKKELEKLASNIMSLRLEISQKEELQKRNYKVSMQKIQDFTLYILKHDLDRQDEFSIGKEVKIDFLRDIFTLDNENNFSASSKIYFKNAILYSIFFASLELTFFRYPRFILCDNMEDKGMEKERTQNLQDLITSMSNKYSTEHQIIFTTSMISDNLNNTPYCVGIEYRKNNRTLNI